MLRLFPKIVKKLLEKIGFKGILMSDDISMKALKYDLVTNAKKLWLQDVIVLYCAGNIKDNYKLIKEHFIDKFTIKKHQKFIEF